MTNTDPSPHAIAPRNERAAAARREAIWMVIAAALFAYFGFGMDWTHRYTAGPDPQLLPMVALLMYTLRISAIAFAISAILAALGALPGLILYAVVGLLGAVAFAAVAAWDLFEPRYFSGLSPFLLLVFAAWNGYSSWQMLRHTRGLAYRDPAAR